METHADIAGMGSLAALIMLPASVILLVAYVIFFYTKLKRCSNGRSSKIADLILIFMAAFILIDGFVALIVPATSCCPPKARRISCSSNLKQIGLALAMYSQENNGAYPPFDDARGLELLRAGGFLENVKLYLCPSTDDIIFDNHEIRDDNCSYVYRGGMNAGSPPDTSIAWDRSNNHDRYGNILFADGHVSGYAGSDWMKHIKPSKNEVPRNRRYVCIDTPLPINEKHLDSKHAKLFSSIRNGDLRSVRELIEANPQLIYATDEHGRSCLWLAYSNPDGFEILEYLFGKGASFKNSGAILRQASENGDMKVIKLLLAHGADIDARCCCGDSALMLASEKSRLETVELLIRSGAQVNLLDESGMSALDHAYDADEKRLHKDSRTIDLLRGLGARTGQELKKSGQASPSSSLQISK